MKPSPLQQVRERFGSRESLIKELRDVFVKPESMSQAEFDQRTTNYSNRYLLKLHGYKERLASEFGGDIGKLIDQIIERRQKVSENLPPDYRESLQQKRVSQLFDINRQLGDAVKRKAA